MSDLPEFFVPVFWIAGRRYRARCRIIRMFRFRTASNRFAEGVVRRFWIGPILLTVLIDAP